MKTISVATATQVKEGELLPVKVEDRKVMLTRVDGKVYALENKCPHLGMPLNSSKVCDRAVTCRWHGATFDLTTGENIKWVGSLMGVPLPEWSHQVLSAGKQARALKTYTVTEQGDEIAIAIDN